MDSLAYLDVLPGLRAVTSLIRRIAATEATVLITGESGVGKELVAQAIHQQSKRAAALMLSENCAAVSESLLESTLFGHERGAFTGAFTARKGLLEMAAEGTLFLDEVGEIPLTLQAKLLRVLQEREFRKVGGSTTLRFSARVIAATNRDLAAMVELGSFREDLYHRLNVLHMQIPPLRERRDDIPLLAKHFLIQHMREHHLPNMTISEAALKSLRNRRWPGNTRELENTVLQTMLLAPSSEIVDIDLAPELYRPATRSVVVQHGSRRGPRSNKQFELLASLGTDSGLSTLEIMKSVGISRATYYRWRSWLAQTKRHPSPGNR